jgi:transcriptional regulator with XRE-family HTH domain
VKQKRQIGDPNRDYAREWREWRLEHKLTQPQMASALGLGLRMITNVERGHVRPRVDSRLKMDALKKRYREAQA